METITGGIDMALVTKFFCTVCKAERSEAIGSGRLRPTICRGCLKFEADCKRREHFGGLDALTLEERMRKIELWIYDYKPPINPMNVRY